MTDDRESGGDILPLHEHGRVLVATLNRPEKANALSREMISALDALSAEVEARAAGPGGIGALVITGAGRTVFCAGADITELVGLGVTAARRQMERGQQVFDRIARLPVAVVAAINGAALGGGLELAMAADIRIAAPTARLGQPEITLGNLPGWGGTQRLPRLIGRALATELILTGDLVTAERAAGIGLINRVEDDPVAAAMTLAGRIADRSPHAIAGAKRAIHAGLAGGMAAGLQVEADAVAHCCQTDEQHAAVAGFLARKPTRT